MPGMDQWHGYHDLYNITLHREGKVPHPEACGAKLTLYGPQAETMAYDLSPFHTHITCNQFGDGWHRTVEKIETQQAPHLLPDIADQIFEVLVLNKITRVREWSNFFYCMSLKRWGSTFISLPSRWDSEIERQVRFVNPLWQLVVETDKPIKKAGQRHIDKANAALLALKNKWQTAEGWDTWIPETYGMRGM